MVQKRKSAAPPPSSAETAPTKRRGRPRAYEPEVALAKALDLFRKDGFAGTSLDDLSAATGMNRPSLYGAFGDKRALYIKTYERYRADARAAMQEAFKGDLPLRKRLLTEQFAGLSEDERAQLAALLGRLVETLQEK